MEIPSEAREKWEKSSFAASNRAFLAANRGGARHVTASRDITDKYSSDALCELRNTNSLDKTTEGGADASIDQSVKPDPSNSNQVPTFAELSYSVAKSKDDHTDEDVQAMKQLGK